MKTIYLRYDNNYIIDREEMLKEYSIIDYVDRELTEAELEATMYGEEPVMLYDYESNKNYCNLIDMPLLISINGTYVKVDDLDKLILNKKDLSIVLDFIEEVSSNKKRKIGGTESDLCFEWKYKNIGE